MMIRTPRAGRTPCARASAPARTAGAARMVRRDRRTIAEPRLHARYREGDYCFPSGRLVADHADLVAVGIPEIGAVVVGMIMRAQSRRTFILAAGRHAGLVGGI